MTPITAEEARAWSFLGDPVMGGRSRGRADFADGALHLTGTVSTENRGGFIQMRRPVTVPQGATGLVLRVRGNGADYYAHLRTRDAGAPWQFFQAPFPTTNSWQEVQIPLAAFQAKGGPARTDIDPTRIESLGIAAYGRDQHADVSLSGFAFR